MKICLVGAQMLNTDGRTDQQKDTHDEANSHFTQFRARA